VVFVQDTVTLRGEVFFPNLQFDKTTVDFGCILNDTEVTRYIHVMNLSPMEVSYRWSFVLSDQSVAVFHRPPDVVESGVVLEDLDNVDTAMCADVADVGVESDTLPAIEVDIAVEGLSTSPTDVHPPTPPALLCEVCIADCQGRGWRKPNGGGVPLTLIALASNAFGVYGLPHRISSPKY